MTLIIFGASLPALGTFTDWNIDIHITTTTAENNQAVISNTTAAADATNAIISDLFTKIKDSVIEIVTVGNVINPKITIDGAPPGIRWWRFWFWFCL
jgi:hypothetical protein